MKTEQNISRRQVKSNIASILTRGTDKKRETFINHFNIQLPQTDVPKMQIITRYIYTQNDEGVNKILDFLKDYKEG